MIWKIIIPTLLCGCIYSCSNDLEEVDEFLASQEILIENSKNIRMIYSDSARVRVIISAPVMKAYLDKTSPSQEFPEGVHADFINNQGVKVSYLESNYALRNERTKIIHCKDSVVVNNQGGSKLETSELFWNEKDGIMYTEKFIRISQGEKGDTTYGVGFESNQDFTKFTIKNKFSAKMTVAEANKELNPE